MAMRWLAISSLAAAIAACAGEGQLTDAPPDAPPQGTTGLVLAFSADPALPGPIGGGGGPAVRIEDVYLNGAIIRAIGDATTGDDQATTRHDHALRWSGGGAPEGVVFDAAPASEYAYVELRIAAPAGADGAGAAFVLRGEVATPDGWTDFVIRAAASVVVARVPAARRLEAGRSLELGIELGAAGLLGAVDWRALPTRAGELRLDEETPAALASFCAALAAAFHAR